jgi:hypothetical protein
VAVVDLIADLIGVKRDEINNLWSSSPPKEPGEYWFYGDPYKGQMGIDYRDAAPPVEPKMYLVQIRKIANGLMAVTEGQFVPLRKFNKAKHGDGYVGYWKEAILPDPPEDIELLFK